MIYRLRPGKQIPVADSRSDLLEEVTPPRQREMPTCVCAVLVWCSRGERRPGGSGRGGGGGVRGEGWHTFVTGRGEAGLAVCLQVAGDVSSAQHLATYVAGDFTLMPDHV